jgi:hypothetical protein
MSKPHMPNLWPGYYKLIGKLAVPVTDPTEWARFFEKSTRDRSRIVAQTHIGGVFVSTVFLALDHRFLEDGPPQLFETMIFRGGKGDDTFRCATWEQAEAQHAEAVAQVRAEIKDKVNE